LLIQVVDLKGVWWPATVSDTKSRLGIQVKYDGYSAKHNEWLDTASKRLRLAIEKRDSGSHSLFPVEEVGNINSSLVLPSSERGMRAAQRSKSLNPRYNSHSSYNLGR
jgi:hypothetical protein